MALWRLITHHQYPEDMLGWVLTTQRLAIGWGRIGDLSAGGYTSHEDIARVISDRYDGIANAPSGGHCLWDFWRTMRHGDLVILGTGERRRAVLRVTGPYEYVATAQPQPVIDYQHQREAELVNLDADHLWQNAGATIAAGYSIRWTLVRCARDVPEATRR